MLRSNSRTGSRSRLPEHLRLQATLELMTQKLEHVRRESAYLDEQIEILQGEIKRPPSTDVKCQSSVRSLHHKLVAEQGRLDELRAENRNSRLLVERTRKELAQSRYVVNCLSRDASRNVQSSEQRHRQTQAQARAHSRQLKSIHLIRSQSAEFKQRFRRNLSQLQSCLRDERNNRCAAKHEFEQGIAHYQGSAPVHVLGLMKDMCARWTAKVAQAKRETDEYLRHVRQLRSSFAQVELATGLNDLDEFVTTVIKSEEQQHDVTAYYSALNAEVETMQETHANKLQLIETAKQSQEGGVASSQALKDNLNQQSERLNTKFQQEQAKVEQIDTVLAESVQLLRKIAQVCVQAKILAPSTLHFEQLQSEQATEVLGRLEEALADAQLVTACQRKEKHPLLTRVPMALLESKAQPGLAVDDALTDLVDDQWVSEAKHPMNLEEFRQHALRISNSHKRL